MGCLSMCSTSKTAYMSFKLLCFVWQAVHACDKPQQSRGEERYKPSKACSIDFSLQNKLVCFQLLILPWEQMRVVGMLAGVITQQPMGARDSQTRKWWYYTSFSPPGHAFLSGLRERFLLSLQRSALVHQLQQSQLLLYTAKIKTRITNIPHNPLSTKITLLFNTEDFLFSFFF